MNYANSCVIIKSLQFDVCLRIVNTAWRFYKSLFSLRINGETVRFDPVQAVYDTFTSYIVERLTEFKQNVRIAL